MIFSPNILILILYVPYHFSGYDTTQTVPAPLLGQHNRQIAGSLGYSAEQIDALVTLSTNPLKYLAVPRVVAATLAMPVLVATGDAIGIMGGWLVGITRLDFNSAAYLKNTVDFLQGWDIGSGLVKGAVFGFIVALMGCLAV